MTPVDEIYRRRRPAQRRLYRTMSCPSIRAKTTQSLQDYLMWQAELTPFRTPTRYCDIHCRMR
ncbi:hypothetical protein KCP74_08630 [Salmonella enterica subsp. enterica]|nr:hypothetical protein KCP74_08630 [Salmonella enterica subsp. enterica]